MGRLDSSSQNDLAYIGEYSPQKHLEDATNIYHGDICKSSIQSEYRKRRTRITPKTVTFHAVLPAVKQIRDKMVKVYKEHIQ